MARTYVGLVFLQGAKPTEAMSQFRIALQIDPTLARAQVGMGVALAYSGKDAEARSAFEQALRLDPANLEARFDLGMVLASLGDRAAALRHIDAVLQVQYSFSKVIVSALSICMLLRKILLNSVTASLALSGFSTTNALILFKELNMKCGLI